MLEGHSNELSIFAEEILMKQATTLNAGTTATNDDYSYLTSGSICKSMMDMETALNPNTLKNSYHKVIVDHKSLAEIERAAMDSSFKNPDLRYRGAKTSGDVLNTSEHQEHQADVSSVEGSMKYDAVTATKESTTKQLNGSSSPSTSGTTSEGAITSESQGTTVRSRFSSSHSSTQDDTCSDCRHHLGPQMICQTIAEEVRELKLLAHAALPDWLKDNDFLHSSHRPPIPCIATCFRSVFSLHSETVNIWTHLIGSLILVGITFWFFVRPSNVPYTWQKVVVFLAFFISAVACMTFSWLYHTLYCHSVQMSKLFSKLDYSGIAILVLGSFVPWLYYGFYCDQTHMIFYIVSMVLLSTCCIVFSLWEKFAAPTYRPMRTATFIGLGLSGVIPFAHGVWNHGLEYTKFAYIATVALLYIGGALIYAFRVPERFLPGKLDIWGHSHQIFHVLVVIAAVVHYNGIITMAEERHLLGECHT